MVVVQHRDCVAEISSHVIEGVIFYDSDVADREGELIAVVADALLILADIFRQELMVAVHLNDVFLKALRAVAVLHEAVDSSGQLRDPPALVPKHHDQDDHSDDKNDDEDRRIQYDAGRFGKHSKKVHGEFLCVCLMFHVKHYVKKLVILSRSSLL